MQFSFPANQISSPETTKHGPLVTPEASSSGVAGQLLSGRDINFLLLDDQPVKGRSRTTDEIETAELVFEQLLVDDYLSTELPVSSATDEIPQEASVVGGGLSTELSTNVQRASLPFRSAGQLKEHLPLLPPVHRPEATTEILAGPIDIHNPLIESGGQQVEPLVLEPIAAADHSDIGSFEPPSVTNALTTPPRELPALPTVLASHQEVTETVAKTIVQQVQLTEVGESKQLSLQLHPAELGQVTLQVDWENDSLKVKIVANEMAANEILNQNRSELIAALAQEGIDFDSLDISYGNAQSEPEAHDKNSRSQQLAPELFASSTESQDIEVANSDRSSNLDITV